LIKLSTALAKKYNINPYKQMTYHKESRKYPYIKNVVNYSVVGHKDTGYTACPGKNLYKNLPYIRAEIVKNLKKNTFVKKEKQTIFKNV
jgi:hypothetical protein